VHIKLAGLLGLGVLALASPSHAATRDTAPAAGYADVLVPGPNGHVVAPAPGNMHVQRTPTIHAMTVQYYYDRYHHRHWHGPNRHYYHRRHSVRIGPVVIR
jgi:hypothetical protein